MKFLVIDDSPEIVEAVSLCLGLRWPQAKFVSTSEGKKGLKLVEEEEPDLVILDIGLPDINGLDVLRSLRDVSEVPVVVLTVRDQDVEIARFLEEGADDFVVKPFSHIELMGRIQAIFRRTQGRVHPSSQPLQAGELLMDFGAAEVYRNGELVNLTRTEMALLTHLVKSATRVVTYETLASKVFQASSPAETDSRLIKVHVQHLRTKLGDLADNPTYIANVYGTGYKFLPQVASALVADNHRNGRRNGH